MAKAALASLPTANFGALRPPFPLRQTQHVQVFPLKLALFCNLFVGLGSINTYAISLLFASSRSVLFRASFYLKLWLYLFSSTTSLLWTSGHSFLPGNDVLMSWRNWECYSCSLQSFVVSHLSYPLMSLSKFFDTQVPLISTEELVLLHHAQCSLSSTLQRTQPSVKLLSLYNRQNRKFFMQRPRTSVPGHLPSHSSLSIYGLFGDSLSLRPLV